MSSKPSVALLAIVDDDNSVSLLRCFNYVQPPLEGIEEGSADADMAFVDDSADEGSRDQLHAVEQRP
eukprot:141035-Chlamydomonas_euryale.AAC.13